MTQKRHSPLSRKQKRLVRLIVKHRPFKTYGEIAKMAGYKVDEEGKNRQVFNLLKREDFIEEARRIQEEERPFVVIAAYRARAELVRLAYWPAVKDVLDRTEGVSEGDRRQAQVPTIKIVSHLPGDDERGKKNKGDEPK